jgi:electron transfer flavoprotein beta subunit
MNLVVCVKHVPDTESRIRVKPDGSGIVTEGLNYVLNPYDEYAIEEAIRIKEKAAGSKVVVVCIGPDDATKSLRTCLAMGADEAVHVADSEFQRFDGVATARALAAVVKDLSFDLVLCGKQAVDDDCAQVGPALAEFLGIPNVSVITRLEVAPDGKQITVQREMEGANETVECPLPALVSAQKGLNEPRYPSLPNIMKAKKMPIKTIAADSLSLGPEGAPKVEVVRFADPPARKAGRVLEGDPKQVVREVITLLVEEAKVL